MNRATRGKEAGINKRGLFKPKQGKKHQLIYGNERYESFEQAIPLKDESKNIIGFRTIRHTRLKK